jgi:hypothetical protein
MSDQDVSPVYVHSTDFLAPLEVRASVTEVSARVAELLAEGTVLDIGLTTGSRLVIHFGRLSSVWVHDHLPEGKQAVPADLWA